MGLFLATNYKLELSPANIVSYAIVILISIIAIRFC